MTSCVIGHRGAAAVAPENTLAAIRAGADAGAQAVEFDVRLTHDRELMLLHDATVDRTSNGRGRAGMMTREQLQQLDFGSWYGEAFAGESAPSLLEALDLCRELGVGAVVEVKDYDCVREMAEALVDAPMKFAVTLICFDVGFLRNFNDLMLPRPTMWLCDELPHAAMRDNLNYVQQQCRAAKAVGVDLNATLLTQPLVAGLQEMKLPVWCYTVNDPERAAELAEWGVEGITTDNPRILRKIGEGSE